MLCPPHEHPAGLLLALMPTVHLLLTPAVSPLPSWQASFSRSTETVAAALTEVTVFRNKPRK